MSRTVKFVTRTISRESMSRRHIPTSNAYETERKRKKNVEILIFEEISRRHRLETKICQRVFVTTVDGNFGFTLEITGYRELRKREKERGNKRRGGERDQANSCAGEFPLGGKLISALSKAAAVLNGCEI